MIIIKRTLVCSNCGACSLPQVNVYILGKWKYAVKYRCRVSITTNIHAHFLKIKPVYLAAVTEPQVVIATRFVKIMKLIYVPLLQQYREILMK